jgi:hypothetical protein
MGTVCGLLFLVVVDQFNVKGVRSFKTENDAPVGRVEAIAGNVQSLRIPLRSPRS